MKLRDFHLQVYGKAGSHITATLSHILFHVFRLHFLRINHHEFFQTGFKSVLAQFLSVKSMLLAIYLFNHDLSNSTFFMLNMVLYMLLSTVFVKKIGILRFLQYNGYKNILPFAMCFDMSIQEKWDRKKYLWEINKWWNLLTFCLPVCLFGYHACLLGHLQWNISVTSVNIMYYHLSISFVIYLLIYLFVHRYICAYLYMLLR